MLWVADGPAMDPRDWYLNLDVTSRDGNNLRGRMQLGIDGYSPTRSVLFDGKVKEQTVELLTVRQDNFQVHFVGKLTRTERPQSLTLTWEGTERANRKRDGTAMLHLKSPGSDNNN